MNQKIQKGVYRIGLLLLLLWAGTFAISYASGSAYDNSSLSDWRPDSTVVPISGDTAPASILSLADSTIRIAENDGFALIHVVLLDTGHQEVEAELAFIENLSSASSEDIGQFRSTSLRFGERAAPGDTLTVSVPITNDLITEDLETALFGLRSTPSVSIAPISRVKVQIVDDESLDIYLNEVHPAPEEIFGDADGNGTVDPVADEFVELVNNGAEAIDISGWKLYDNAAGEPELRHIFPESTIVPAGGALVLFGGTEPLGRGGFGGAVVQRTTEGRGLGLDDTGDQLKLTDAHGHTIFTFAYTTGGDFESLNRVADAKEGAVRMHSSLARGYFSPGTRLDGRSFHRSYARQMDGGEGWRMISSPVKGLTFSDLLDGLRVEGIRGSGVPAGDATILAWRETEGGAYLTPEKMDTPMEPARGYMVFLFEDDQPDAAGVQGGFPKLIGTDSDEIQERVSVTVSATDANDNGRIDGGEGWNLLGNPFGVSLSAEALSDLLIAADPDMRANGILLWDPQAGNGRGAFVAAEPGDRVMPFEAFWVRFTNPGMEETVVFEREELAFVNGNSSTAEVSTPDRFKFTLSLSGDTHFDRHSILFTPAASVDLDADDRFKPPSLTPGAINLFGLYQGERLLQNAISSTMNSVVHLPLGFHGAGNTTLTMSWDGLERMPEGWRMLLIDTKLNKEIDLSTVDDYKFSMEAVGQGSEIDRAVLEDSDPNREFGDLTRFKLAVIPPGAKSFSDGIIPTSVKLNQNYPNPFNPATTVSFELTEQSHVMLNIYTIVGQKVATLVDEVRDVGSHRETWNASDMPSGIYIAQLEVQGQVYIRKMTLIK